MIVGIFEDTILREDSCIGLFTADCFDDAAKIAVESLKISWGLLDESIDVDKVQANKWKCVFTRMRKTFRYVIKEVQIYNSPEHL